MVGGALRRAARSIVYATLLRPAPRPFIKEEQNCWSFRLPSHRGLAEANGSDLSAQSKSPLLLFEDRRYLGPPHCPRRFVASVGRGRFDHQGDSVFFSTSDNSDPNTNGREYSYSTSRWLYRRGSGMPVNFRARDVGPDVIDSAVDYALEGGQLFLNALRRDVTSLEGLTIAELGPGIDFGTVMFLACHGAKPVVADPYLAGWDENFHPKFYKQLRDRITAADRSCDVSVLSRLIAAGRYTDDVISRYSSPVEMSDIADDSIDVVFSKAVGEHFYDSRAAFAELFRLTRPGGLGYHWIDFRDHRDFDRPLEFLLMPDDEFLREFGLSRGQLGNRVRPHETADILEGCGFEILGCEPTMHAKETYLNDFIPRLEAAQHSSFRHLQRDDLDVLGSFYRVRKPAAGAEESQHPTSAQPGDDQVPGRES